MEENKSSRLSNSAFFVNEVLRGLIKGVKAAQRDIHIPGAKIIPEDMELRVHFAVEEFPGFGVNFDIPVKISAIPEPDAAEGRPQSAILNTKIRDIPDSIMPTRIKQRFACANIEIIRDIVNLPDAKELLKYRNIGYKSISQVESFLESCGLSFGMFNQK
ncbi:MAG: hypothetical protein LBK58_08120 [Prevotellaceae bacterium]|jgi:DNA-directed RNA polymerase alpha subunit|nr:hypothetical protein [Prevotellaceae bacterium]